MAERILCVLGKLKAGGVESVMYSYYRTIDRTRFQYDFVYEESSDFDVPEDITALGAKSFKVPDVSSVFKYVSAVRRIIKAGKYKIVHSNLNTLSVFSLFAAWTCGVKYRILHNHTTSSPVEKKRDFLKKVLRPFNVLLANKYVACSDLSAVWMYGKRKYKNGKVTVFRNGVDVEKFSFREEDRTEIRKEFNIENYKVIGHIGRFVSVKNHLFIIDIFKKYKENNVYSKLMLVGDGELLESVKAYVAELDLCDSVIFTGVRSDVDKLLSAFDVFVLPSLYEGLPVVAIEASAAGLPVLLSDKITRECAVTDAVSFYSIDDAKIWADALADIEEPDREKLSLQMASGPYNIHNCAGELEAYYSECV